MGTRAISRSIVGRDKEIAILEALHDSQDPQLVAIYGRRRIGKTFLIREFFRDKGIYFELTGAKDATTATQLKNFNRVYAETFGQRELQKKPRDWYDAFDLLRKRAQGKPPKQKLIIFLDELPWLASPRSKLLSALSYTWNRYLERENGVIVVVCGSAASWMIKKVVKDRAGLYGRLTRRIHMLPFTLSEMRRFLEAQRVQLSAPQLIELHMAVGGVAKYLAGLQPGHSVDQLIQARYFDRDAPLKGEFHQLFRSLFDDYVNHLKIIEALAGSRYGLSVERIVKETGLSGGGGLTDILTELKESGFITFVPQFNNRKKSGKYVLTDEFTLFYLKWVKPVEDGLDDLSGYWQRQAASQEFRIWAGYAFETFCLKNTAAIKRQLGIAGVTATVSQWHDDGAQIDLVLDRADGCINLCEIKFHRAEYTMTQKDAQAIVRKRERFLAGTKTRKALFPTLITVNGAARNAHFNQVIVNHVEAERFIE